MDGRTDGRGIRSRNRDRRSKASYCKSSCLIFLRGVFFSLVTVDFFLEPADITFYPFFGLSVVGEFSLVSLERWSVIVAAAVDVFGRVMDVEHFVKDDVFDHVFWHRQGIERTADRNVVVCGVMMTEDAKCLTCRPREHGFGDRFAKILRVQTVENFVEIIDGTLRTRYDLAASGFFAFGGFLTDRVGFYVCRIHFTGSRWDLFAKQFTNEDVGKAFVADERHLLANDADPHINFGIADPNCMIYTNIWVK